jgi:hypothetical protein
MLSRHQVFQKIKETKKLPSPSGTMLRVVQLCHDDNTSMTDIADAIAVDPSLSAELLKYANTFYRASGLQISSVNKAAIKLGIRTVVNLALGLSLISNNKNGKCKTFDYPKFWATSLLQAIAAKNIAAAGKEFDQEEIFICALLSHMGWLAFAGVFPQEYGDLLSEFEFESCGDWGMAIADDIVSDRPYSSLRKTLEKEQFGIDSSELTVELFLHWGLPAHYALAAGYHDDLGHGELGFGQTRKIAELLNLCRHIAEICLYEGSTDITLQSIGEAAREYGIAKDQFGDIFDSIILQWQDVGEMFDIQTYQIRSFNQIMTAEDGQYFPAEKYQSLPA